MSRDENDDYSINALQDTEVNEANRTQNSSFKPSISLQETLKKILLSNRFQVSS